MGSIKRTCAGIAASVVLAAGAALSAPAEVKLANVQGDVTVIKQAGASWEKATNGMTLREGAKIKTGAGASCMLAFPGGHAVKLNPLSATAIDKADLTGKTEKTQLSIDSGKVFAKVGKLGDKSSSFSVKTPTAVAGVRGSEIMVTVGEQESSFQVTEGSFAVEAGGIEALLDENFQIDISQGETAAEPEPIPETELQELKTEIEEIKVEIQEAGITIESAAPSEGETKEEAKEETKEEATEETAEETAETAENDAVDSVDTVTDNQTINNIVDEQAEVIEAGTGDIELIIE